MIGHGFCSRAGALGNHHGADVRSRHSRLSKWPQGNCWRDDKGEIAGCESNDAACSCIEQCKACARCRFVSSRVRRARNNFTQCLWYTECDTSDLRTNAGPRSSGDWRTVRVRDGAAPAPLPPSLGDSVQPLRLAIATLAFGKADKTSHCGLVGWCQGARRFRRAVPRQWTTTLLVLTHGVPPNRSRCPDAEYVSARPRLARLGLACQQRVTREGYYFRYMPKYRRVMRHPAAPAELFLKWQLLAMREYDAVLYPSACSAFIIRPRTPSVRVSEVGFAV
jgi:hypothetical protein